METRAQVYDRIYGRGNWFYGGRLEPLPHCPHCRRKRHYTKNSSQGKTKRRRKIAKASRRRNRGAR